MREITLEELLAAGCHFGHQITRANPKARDFVYESRDGIQIIDLAKTKEGLEEAGAFIKNLASQGETLLVVGTKRQAQETLKKEMEKADNSRGQMHFILERWIGGILTNFPEISKNIKKLEDLEKKLQSEEERAKYTKKEIGLWEKEKQRLESLYGGIRKMTKIPDALFVIDSHLEALAVKEAKSMGVPIAGIVDTNADPTLVDYPIPANDDAQGSIDLITDYIIEAWNEGSREQVKSESEKAKSLEKTEKEVKNGKRKPRKTKKVA